MVKDELQGAGLALRVEFISELREHLPAPVNFIEITPENWMNIGGAYSKKFSFFANHYPLVAHGVSLSLGSPAPLDHELLDNLKLFLDKHQIKFFSEHLSYCSDHHGHLYDKLPIPFTYEAAEHVASRIIAAQEILERKISLENTAYYCTPGQKMTEFDFIKTVMDLSGCDLLLDLNTLYVNSVNHGYDPFDFVRALPKGRVAYLHLAGHEPYNAELLLNSHGREIARPVWDLLEVTYQVHGVLPTLLERDHNIPPLSELLRETREIKNFQERARRIEYV